MSANVGDTIKWVWIEGSHTTTSGSVPAGASLWDTPITSSSTSFSYKILAPGNYSYLCRPHAPNMSGFIFASAVSGISPVASAPLAISLFPSPFQQNLTVNLSGVDASTSKVSISMCDLLGKTVYHTDIDGALTNRKLDIQAADLPAGIYFVNLFIDDRKLVYKVIKSN